MTMVSMRILMMFELPWIPKRKQPGSIVYAFDNLHRSSVCTDCNLRHFKTKDVLSL
jgi:hypothetical protein